MPLEQYPRGKYWWAKGRVEVNGRPVSEYIRESTGATTEAGAKDWIAERTAFEQRKHFVGREAVELPITFAEAVDMYEPTPDMAKYLIPIVKALGSMPCKDITPDMVRQLGKRLYPKNSTDSWRRWVIAPTRAVINNAHKGGHCPYIRIDGYEKKERVKQDAARGKRSRVAKTPGSWEWLLMFRQKASKRHAALAFFMFATGARIGQAVAMHPDQHLKLDEGKVIVPGAKGHEDRELEIPPELVADLRGIVPKTPRGWDRSRRANLRVFGWASKDGPRKGWMRACKLAKIEYLPPHSAGRHGFGQEMRVRQGVDKKAIEAFGGWSATGDMIDKTYTHAEDHAAKIHGAFRTGLVQAQNQTGLKL
jgi:integrase